MDFAPLVDVAISLAAVTLTGIVGWVGNWVRKNYKSQALDIATQQVEALIGQGIDMAKGKYKERAKSAAQIETDSEVLDSVVEFVNKQGPEVMKEAGVDEEWVRRQVPAMLDRLSE